MNPMEDAVKAALKATRDERLRKKLESVLYCRPKHFCRNVQLCQFCIRLRQKNISAKIEAYRRRKGILYGFLRTEEFLLDSLDDMKPQYQVLKDRIRKIRRTMPKGSSRLRGWVSRYELVWNKKENCWSLRVVTLLLFRRRNITTRSPYWTEKTVWEEDGSLKSGTPRHSSRMKYLGPLRHPKQSVSVILHSFQLPEFYKQSAEALLKFLTLTGSSQTWVTGGELFQKPGKRKTVSRLKPVRKYKIIKCKKPVQIAKQVEELLRRKGREDVLQESRGSAVEAGPEVCFQERI